MIAPVRLVADMRERYAVLVPIGRGPLRATGRLWRRQPGVVQSVLHETMPFSVRLDPQTEAAIERLARSSGKSRSSVVREAVARYASAADANTTAYERLEPLIGVVRSGRTDLSQHTGRKFTEVLKTRRAARARRSR